MSDSSLIMDQNEVNQVISELSVKMSADLQGEKVILMGMATRGVPLSQRIQRYLVQNGVEVETGIIDATFYRDDYHFRTQLKNPKLSITQMASMDVENQNIILVDDVLYTGRSIRSAMEAIFEMGRPKTLQVCVLIDRDAIELPIFAKYIGKFVKTNEDQEIKVSLVEIDGTDSVSLVSIGD